MLNMILHVPSLDITGTVDAERVTPDGKAIVRICDRWVDADSVVAV